MIQLVTLVQVKNRLNIDFNDKDSDLELIISGCTHMILAHLKSSSPYMQAIDSQGNLVFDVDKKPVYTTVIKPAIISAAFLLVGYMFKDLDNDKNKEWEENNLPRPVRAILNPFRDPAFL